MTLSAYLRKHHALAADDRMVAANGLEFEVTVAGEGNKAAICLHGFPEHAMSWRYQVPCLVELGYRVWVPNLRGYGKTSSPEGKAAYVIDNLLADVGALIDRAQADAETEEVVLLAHDWGALIAWEFAMRRTRPIDRLVVMNVPHPAVAIRHSRKWYQLKKSWYVIFFQIQGLPEWGLTRSEARTIDRAFLDSALNKNNFPEDVIDVYRENVLRPGGATAMINYYRANFGSGKLTGFDGGKPPLIEIPVLMIWGENDIALDIRLTEGTDTFVKNLTLRHLPGVSHWVQQDAPDTVNQMLEAWLTEQRVPAAGDFSFPLT